jgi:hypothetical protein
MLIFQRVRLHSMQRMTSGLNKCREICSRSSGSGLRKDELVLLSSYSFEIHLSLCFSSDG